MSSRASSSRLQMAGDQLPEWWVNHGSGPTRAPRSNDQVGRARMKSGNDAPIPMTEEQKFFFDLRGWILLPGVLSDAEIAVMKAEAFAAVDPSQHMVINPDSSFQGTLQTLLDHPAIVGILSEILAERAIPVGGVLRLSLRELVYHGQASGLEQAGTERRRDASCRAPSPTGQRDAISGSWRKDFCRTDTRCVGTGGGESGPRRHILFERFA